MISSLCLLWIANAKLLWKIIWSKGCVDRELCVVISCLCFINELCVNLTLLEVNWSWIHFKHCFVSKVWRLRWLLRLLVRIVWSSTWLTWSATLTCAIYLILSWIAHLTIKQITHISLIYKQILSGSYLSTSTNTCDISHIWIWWLSRASHIVGSNCGYINSSLEKPFIFYVCLWWNSSCECIKL